MSPAKLSCGSAGTMSSWAWMQSRSLPFCQFSTLLFWFLPYQNIPISLLPRNCLALYFQSGLLQPVKKQLTAPCSLQRIPYQVLDDQRSDSYKAQVKYVQEICSFFCLCNQEHSYKSTAENLTLSGMCCHGVQSQNCLSGDGSLRSICTHNLCIFFEQSAWYCLMHEAPYVLKFISSLKRTQNILKKRTILRRYYKTTS